MKIQLLIPILLAACAQAAPIVLDGLEGWSIPYSTDKPLKNQKKKKGK